MLFIAYSVSARAGGAGPSRSRGDDGGGIGDLIYIILWVLLNVPFPFNIIIIGIIIFIFYKTKKTHANNHSAFKGNNLARRNNSPGLDRELGKLAYFNKEAFLNNSRKAFMRIQKAWANKNIADIRNLISDGVYQRFVTQVEMMGLLKQTNKLDKIELLDAWIDKITPSEIYDIIHIGFKANIRDQFISELSKSLYHGGEGYFVEYWTFIRKKDIRTVDLFSAEACPNCGAPLEKKATDTAKCDYCNTILNSGEYDWVLSKITQAEDYSLSRYAESKLKKLNNKVEIIMNKDPEFSVQKLEDKASNAYLQIMSARAFCEPVRIRRFVTDNFFHKFSSSLPEKQIVYNRLYLNSVNLIALGNKNGNNFAALSVKSSYQRVILHNNRIERILDSYVYSKNEIMIFLKNRDIKVNKASLYAHNCPNCAAPVLDTMDIHCQYCNEPVNSLSREWILDDILNSGEYNSFIKEDSAETVKEIKPQIIDEFYDVRDYTINNLMMIIGADGIFHDKEREFVLSYGKKYGYSKENIQVLFQLARSKGLSIKMPDSPAKRAKIYKLMEKAAGIDGHIHPREKEILEDVRRVYDISA